MQMMRILDLNGQMTLIPAGLLGVPALHQLARQWDAGCCCFIPVSTT